MLGDALQAVMLMQNPEKTDRVRGYVADAIQAVHC